VPFRCESIGNADQRLSLCICCLDGKGGVDGLRVEYCRSSPAASRRPTVQLVGITPVTVTAFNDRSTRSAKANN